MKGLRANGLALMIVLIAIAAYVPFAPVRLYDFRAFYCAGKAVAARADPYREHPLHECEWTTFAPGMPIDSDVVTVPAPLPGYALALFAALTWLPFPICALLWVGSSLTAIGVTIVLLQRSIALPLSAISVAIFLPAAIVAIPLGQLAPFVGLGVAICAYGLKRERPLVAAAGALVTALAPPIAIVLCPTLLIAVPRTRIVLVAGTIGLIALSLVALGVDTNVEYLRVVLAAHAIGNVAERSQFSTSHFAWVAGLASGPALAFGKAWYGAAAIAGIWVALRQRTRDGPVALALVPPAFAVFGGLYVHFDEVVLALPAYLLVAARSSSQPRIWMLVAIFILAVPWLALAAFPPFAIALVVLAVIYARDVAGIGIGMRLGLGAAALLLVFFAIVLGTMHASAASFRFESLANPLAETSWSRYVAWRDARPSPTFVLLQLPTVIAFIACLASVFRKDAFSGSSPVS